MADHVASIATLIDFSLAISIKLAKFVYDAKDATKSKGDLFSKAAGLQQKLVAVGKTLETRKAQIEAKPVNPNEELILNTMKDTLELCMKTVERFEKKVQSLGTETESTWWQKAILQLRLEVRGSEIKKIEEKIDTNTASLQLLLACFEPFMHESTQQLLQAGNEIISQSLSKLWEQITSCHNMINRISQDTTNRHAHASSAPNIIATTTDALEDDNADLKQMKKCIGTAESLVHSISREGSTVGRGGAGPVTQLDSNTVGNLTIEQSEEGGVILPKDAENDHPPDRDRTMLDFTISRFLSPATTNPEDAGIVRRPSSCLPQGGHQASGSKILQARFLASKSQARLLLYQTISSKRR
ncbi:hypothetical protein BJ546DRAFT_1070369 [Cryomyces antarcticus]